VLQEVWCEERTEREAMDGCERQEGVDEKEHRTKRRPVLR
jgi:hypothetical protein